MEKSHKRFQEKYEFQFAEQHSMISAEYWAQAYGPYRLGKPTAIDALFVSQKGYLHAYAAESMLSEWKRLSEKLLHRRFRKAVLHSSRKAREAYRILHTRIRQKQFETETDRNLLTELKNYCACLHTIAHHFVLSQPEGLFALTAKIQTRLREKKAMHHMDTLVATSVPDIIVREQRARAAFAREKAPSEEQLKQHAFTHAWLFFNSYDEDANVQFLRERLREPFDARKKQRARALLKRRQKNLFQKIGDAALAELCQFLQAISVERLELKDCWGGAEYRCLSLFTELSRRIGLPLETMMRTYTLSEYDTFLREGKRLAKMALAAREKEWVFHKRGDTLTCYDNAEEIHKAVGTVLTSERIPSITELKGEPASSGNAKGICRIVETRDIAQVLRDLARFRPGDILVTHMTQPNMMPIAARAGAIVADEGGITSHAAVIARELKIPCVVGAKVATRVLTDGMTIEVNGATGKITVLGK